MEDSKYPVGFSEKGFTLPKGYSWDASSVNGLKDGMVTVRDKSSTIQYVLNYKHDKLYGVSEFYDHGVLVEKRTYVNNVEDGYGCIMDNGEEIHTYLYKDGVKQLELVPHPSLEDYWETRNYETGALICISMIDKEYRPIGKSYVYKDDKISEVVLIQSGRNNQVLKKFENNIMTEIDGDEEVYKGEYMDDIEKDYPRHGEGDEFKDGERVYTGIWSYDKRNGRGTQLCNGKAEYDGEWKDGVPNGKGRLYDSNHKIIMKGKWIDGKLKQKDGRLYSFLSGGIEDDPTMLDLYDKLITNSNGICEIMNDDFEFNEVRELIIESSCGNDIKDSLVIQEYYNLEMILFKTTCLQNLSELRICNNPHLKRIDINGGSDKDKCAFSNVQSFCLKSTFYYLIVIGSSSVNFFLYRILHVLCYKASGIRGWV